MTVNIIKGGKMSKNALSSYWGVMFARGIVAMLFGIMAIFWTGLTIELLVLFFAVYAIVSGILYIGGAIFSTKNHDKWFLFLLEGIFSIILGILIVTWPAVTVLIFLYFLAIWILIGGIFEMIIGFSNTEQMPGAWILGVVGIISFVLGIVLLLFPAASVTVFIWILGIYSLVVGLFLTVLSFQIKKD